MAASTSVRTVARTLNQENQQLLLVKLPDLVGSFLLYIVAWVNQTADGVVRQLLGLNPTLHENINEVQFLQVGNLNNFVRVKEFDLKLPVESIPKSNPNYLQDLTKKTTELKDGPTKITITLQEGAFRSIPESKIPGDRGNDEGLGNSLASKRWEVYETMDIVGDLRELANLGL
ncbi:hypothetical protein FA15DRAFT_672797 [Coprinopsis marcescibilis]|uniref:Uncharacterized protein n=1 Tax=Coprinopsis marcescibilis TaxID=230819 RepID=A0A5C3KMS0_COPMA|nr:hypothetical protein FA15DRAFT_672797 [Coprinopsis marcescibilis]